MQRRAVIAGCGALLLPPSAMALSKRLAPALLGSKVQVIGLQDNFNDNAMDTSLWVQNNIAGTGSGTTVSETGGALNLTPAVSDATPRSDGYVSVNSFSIVGKRAFVKTVQRINTGGVSDMTWGLATGVQYVQFVVFSTSLIGQRKNGGGNTSAFANQTWSASRHTWTSIREHNGLFYLDAAGDNASNPPSNSDWVNLGSVSFGSVDPTSVKAFLSAGNNSSTASPGTGIFDGFCVGT